MLVLNHFDHCCIPQPFKSLTFFGFSESFFFVQFEINKNSTVKEILKIMYFLAFN